MRICTSMVFGGLIGRGIGLTGIWLSLSICTPLQAAQPNFDELLAKARALAAVGHRFSPAGDNVVETVLALYKLIAVATPRQLDSFSNLIDGEDLIQPKWRNDPPPTGIIPVVADSLTDLNSETGVVPLHRDVALTPPNVGRTMEIPDPRVTALFTKGQAAEERGDISAARRFYTDAARLGHAAAARNLGRLYDPAYVRQAAIGGIHTDPAVAAQWYERAAALGDPRAAPLFQALNAR